MYLFFFKNTKNTEWFHIHSYWLKILNPFDKKKVLNFWESHQVWEELDITNKFFRILKLESPDFLLLKTKTRHLLFYGWKYWKTAKFSFFQFIFLSLFLLENKKSVVADFAPLKKELNFLNSFYTFLIFLGQLSHFFIQ